MAISKADALSAKNTLQAYFDENGGKLTDIKYDETDNIVCEETYVLIMSTSRVSSVEKQAVIDSLTVNQARAAAEKAEVVAAEANIV
tara:strand:- start:10954 stop:11214 length:261 start_codon:yes stop_codon:yes gene_type:complete